MAFLSLIKGVVDLKRAKAWVRKKLRKGVPKGELYACLGVFSNRKKSKVMAEKNLSEKQYKRRYEFCSNAFLYLEEII